MAALGLKPEYFEKDVDLFGHVFENMVLRDLLAYAQVHDAHILHYSDDLGLEADAVYQAADGRYAFFSLFLRTVQTVTASAKSSSVIPIDAMSEAVAFSYRPRISGAHSLSTT